MKPILTPAQAVDLDRQTQAFGIAGETLMERAGLAVARAAVDLLGGTYGRRAVIVCGKGNNGGDGLVAARHLERWGVRTAVHMIGPLVGGREPAAGNLRRLETETAARVRGFAPGRLARDLARADVAVDAVFGTGFRGIPEDDWAAAIDEMNASTAPVVAIDIPSGVDGTSGGVAGDAVRADLTVTFGAAKTGVILLPGAEFAGAVRVVDIGYPDDLIHADAFLIEPSDVVASVPVRPADTHKRAAGVLLVVAGSRAMTGAVKLIAEAAGRMGAGLVIVAAPEGIVPVVQSVLTEAVFLPLRETSAGTVSAGAFEQLEDALARVHAMAIGPGMSTDPETAGFIRDLVRVCPVPFVLDADGLTAFTGRAGDLADRKSAAVLTPHAGEFERLTGVSPRLLDEDRLGHVRALAAEAQAVALLKGSRTIVAEPGGAVRVNPTGTSVLATAGSGDVLTGMIGGLLARGVAPVDAASSAAYLHGLAGILAGRLSGEGTLAGDLLDQIPAALDKAMSQSDKAMSQGTGVSL